MKSFVISILLSLIVSLNFIAGGARGNINEGSQRELGRWEVLTQSPITSTIPISPDVVFFDENNGLAADSVHIIRSVDGGKTWDVIYSLKRKAVQALVFSGDNIGWVVGGGFGSDKENKPFVLSSKDRGVSWQQVTWGKNDLERIEQKFTRFNDICFSSTGKSWIVGDAGIVETLVDGQNLKVVSLFPTPEALYSVSCSNEGGVWGVGERGAVYHFQQGWDRKQIDKTFRFSKVKLIGNDIWLLGYKTSPNSHGISGVLLRSRDNGMSWEDKSPEKIRFFSDIYLNKGDGWLVGSEGSIYYSSTDGDSWEKLDSPTKNNLESIYFLDAKNIWISGTNQTILKFKTN